MYNKASASEPTFNAWEIMRSLSLGGEIESFLRSAMCIKPQSDGSTGLRVLDNSLSDVLSKSNPNSVASSNTGEHLTPEVAGSGRTVRASVLGSFRA